MKTVHWQTRKRIEREYKRRARLRLWFQDRIILDANLAALTRGLQHVNPWGDMPLVIHVTKYCLVET